MGKHLPDVEFERLRRALKAGGIGERMKAIRALGESRDGRAVRPLIAVLQNENGFVWQAAAAALGKLGGKEAARALVTSLFKDDFYFDKHEPTPHSTTYVTRALLNVGVPAVPFLLAALENEKWANSGRCGRWRAADVLGRMKAKTAVPGLLMHLAAGGDDVRPAVAVALAAIGDPAALPGLRLVAAHDPLPGVRLRAQNAVERIAKIQAR